MNKGYGNCKKAYSTKGKCGNICYIDESADCDDREWSGSAKAWFSWKACPDHIGMQHIRITKNCHKMLVPINKGH